MSNDSVVLDRRFIPAGTLFIREGEDAYSAFIIQSGSVSVYSERNGITVEFAKLGVGEICGEMALISNEPRNANVKALEDTNLIAITQMEFDDRIKDSDRVIQAVMNMLIMRVNAGNAETMEKKTDPGAIVDTAHFIYANLIKDFPPKKAEEFERTVKPKLSAFIAAVEGFTL